MQQNPSSRSATLAASAAAALALMPIIGVAALGWQPGNVIILLLAEAFALLAVSLIAERRALRIAKGVGESSTVVGRVLGEDLPGLTKPNGILLLALGSPIVLFVGGALAYNAGIDASPQGLLLPLVLVVARTAVEAVTVLGRPDDQAGDAARGSLLASVVRGMALVAAIWLLFEFRPSSNTSLWFLTAFVVAKAALEARLAWLSAHGRARRNVKN